MRATSQDAFSDVENPHSLRFVNFSDYGPRARGGVIELTNGSLTPRVVCRGCLMEIILDIVDVKEVRNSNLRLRKVRLDLIDRNTFGSPIRRSQGCGGSTILFFSAFWINNVYLSFIQRTLPKAHWRRRTYSTQYLLH